MMVRIFLFLCCPMLLVSAARTGDPFPPEPNNENRGSRNLIQFGTPAEDGEYPFHVSLHIHPSIPSSFCGATLIYEDILLTAAHCVEPLALTGNEFARIGSTKVDSGGESITIRGYQYHLGYDLGMLIGGTGVTVDDIALVALARPSSTPTASFNDDPLLPLEDDSLKIVGFGATERKMRSDVLLEAKTLVRDSFECLGTMAGLNPAPATTICALGSKNEATCKGDSGGPLLKGDIVFGVNSRSFPDTDDCNAPGAWDIFTRVSYYSDWIKEGICQLSLNPPDHCYGSSSKSGSKGSSKGGGKGASYDSYDSYDTSDYGYGSRGDCCGYQLACHHSSGSSKRSGKSSSKACKYVCVESCYPDPSSSKSKSSKSSKSKSSKSSKGSKSKSGKSSKQSKGSRYRSDGRKNHYGYHGSGSRSGYRGTSYDSYDSYSYDSYDNEGYTYNRYDYSGKSSSKGGSKGDSKSLSYDTYDDGAYGGYSGEYGYGQEGDYDSYDEYDGYY